MSNLFDCDLVFDNYDGNPSTKDHTHIRRTGGVVGHFIEFTSKTVFSLARRLSYQTILTNKDLLTWLLLN